MSQLLGSVASWFGKSGSGGSPNWLTAILGGLGGAGEIGNILTDQKRSSLLNQSEAWSKLTPQQLSAKVAAATQPLSQGLTSSVGNVVQGQVAERGLAESPGIYSEVLAQALAPYYQQNQQTALNEILAQMGLPLQEASLLKDSNLSPIFAMLMNSFKGGDGSGSGLTSDFSSSGNVVDSSFPPGSDTWTQG
jgi:hypothetical protein